MEKLLELANICLDNKIFYGTNYDSNNLHIKYGTNYYIANINDKHKNDKYITVVNIVNKGKYNKYLLKLNISDNIEKNSLFPGMQINFTELPTLSIGYNRSFLYEEEYRKETIIVETFYGLSSKKVEILYEVCHYKYDYYILHGSLKIEISEEEYNALHQKYIDNRERLQNEQSISLIEERIQKYKSFEDPFEERKQKWKFLKDSFDKLQSSFNEFLEDNNK